MEHHSNLLPWQMVARKTGAVLKFLECEMDGSLPRNDWTPDFPTRQNWWPSPRCLTVMGRENPIRKIIQMAHARGAVVVIDAAQSAPHMAIDVQELDADFLAFSAHKLMGPMGIGVLYGKKKNGWSRCRPSSPAAR